MKFKVEHEGDVYAVATATGTSKDGRKYANVLLKKEAILAIRSNYSLFLDPNDKTLMNQLNLTDLTYSEDGTRKVTLLKEPIKLQEKYKLISVSHAPYKVDDRVIRSTYCVCEESDSTQATVDRAVQRGFDRAESFFKNPEFYDDYRKFVLFDVSKEELESLLQQTEELED